MTQWLKRALSCAVILCLLTGTALAAEGTVNTKALILRKSASSSAKALQTLEKGDKLEILSTSGDWYKVSYGKYKGYVMKKYVKASGKVTEDSSSTAAAATNTNTATASATYRPGDKGSGVKTLQKALKSLKLYTGSIDGVYGSGTTAAVKAFQKKNKLTQDGVAGPKTLAALLGGNGNSQEIATERLDWFNGGSGVIPKGATVTIKDVKTGKTFTAVRWSGANHMDTEPATRDDTAAMKDIYGGDWSWDRRAILVKYNGHVYAASMNGMPHGTSTRDNGFDGHFCVHFYKSRTHGTDRVDEDHQSAVSSAMKATW